MDLALGELVKIAQSMKQKSTSGETIHNETRQFTTLDQIDSAWVNSALLQTQVNDHCNKIISTAGYVCL